MLDGLAAALNSVLSLAGVTVTAGIQGQAAPGDSADGEPGELGELVMIATAHEYGLGVPERPFMYTTVVRYGTEWAQAWDGVVVSATHGDGQQVESKLRRLGVAMVGNVQQTITDGPWEPNTLEWVAAKGSDRPLIDSGQMRQSIRAQVERPGSPPVVVS